MNAAILELVHGVFDFAFMRDDVETAFGGQLFAFLRHEAGVMRPDFFGERHHRRRHGHL